MLNEYKQYRKRLNTEMRKVRNMFFCEMFNDIVLKCTDQTWKHLNNLIHPSNRSIIKLNISDNKLSGTALAEAFNECFVNVV